MPDMSHQSPSGASVQSVTRAMGLLAAVAGSANGLTAKELSTRLGLHLPTTYHLLRTLQQGAFLSRATDRRYRLDVEIGTLAEGLARQLNPDETLSHYARSLADATHELTHVSMRRGVRCILLRNIDAQHAVQTAAPFLGALDDLHARATGKVAIAWAPPDVREEFFRAGPLQRRTPATVTDRESLELELDRVREQGYATSLEEADLGVCSIAAPIDAGASPFIIALTAPRERFDRNFDSYLGALLATVASASSASAVQHRAVQDVPPEAP